MRHWRYAAPGPERSRCIIAHAPALLRWRSADRRCARAPDPISARPGEGVEGCVDGRHVIVGGVRFVSGKVAEASLSQLRAQRPPGSVAVAVGVDGRLVGLLILADRLRAGTEALLRRLKSLGVARIVLATGDRRDVAEMVVRDLPIDAVRSELSPDQKTLVVLSERKNGPVAELDALTVAVRKKAGWLSETVVALAG